MRSDLAAFAIAIGTVIASSIGATHVVAAEPQTATQPTTEQQSIGNALPALETSSIETKVSAAVPSGSAIGQAARVLLEPDPPAKEPAAQYADIPQPSSEERDRIALSQFYQSRQDEPLWVTSTGYTAKALNAIAELKRAAEWGFDPAIFPVPELPLERAGGPDLAAVDLAKAETRLSLAMMKYARFARGAQINNPPEELSSYIDRRPQVRDRKLLLEAFASSSDPASILVGLHPQQPQFEKLRQAWLEARRVQKGKLPKLPAGADLKPGDRNPQIAVLRKRLDIPVATNDAEDLYDDELAKAMKGFQLLRDIEPADGVVTAATRSELAKPQKANVEQLAANMQSWRWMPEDWGQFHVWVNVPEFMIRIVKNGELVFTERITAGLVAKQTPIFSDRMELVTFKSIWKVPDSIKVREIWPSLLRGGALMRQHGLRMERNGQDVDWTKIDWSKTSMEEYNVYQPPGPKNQLGLVKFSFPSKHYVFMHDTPDKYMFNWTRRANSHGCMRIRNPLQMAAVILGEDKGWDRAKIDDLVRNGPDHNVIELEKKIPVHITYFTAEVGKGGKISTFADVYGHEKRIKLALAGKWSQIARGPDHLAPVDEKSVPRVAVSGRTPKKSEQGIGDFISSALGGL